MKVWLVQTGEQLPVAADSRKLRTRLLAEELANRGHSVTWWASAFNHMHKDWYFSGDTTFAPLPGITIHALHGCGYRRNISPRRLLDHRLISRKFSRLAEAEDRPDVVVASLPPHDLAASVVGFAAQRSIPVIVDVRDKWPDIFVDALPSWMQGAGELALHHEYRLRDTALVNADAILSMTEPLLDWGLTTAGRARGPDDRVFYLGAYRDSGADAPSYIRELIATRLTGRMVVTFMGQFATSSDPGIALDAARQLVDLQDLVVVLAGDGVLAPTLRESAVGLGNVVFTGWVDSPAMAAILDNSDLGLVTTGRTGERHFLPNKVFNYLSHGVPIASVFDGELRQLVDQWGFGFNFSTLPELVAGIRRLHANRTELAEMSDRAQAFFDERGDAAKIYRDYADYIESVAATAEASGR